MDSALLSVGDLHDGSGGQLTDDLVLLCEAVDEALQYLRLKSEVDLVGLMEVLVDLGKHLGS